MTGTEIVKDRKGFRRRLPYVVVLFGTGLTVLSRRLEGSLCFCSYH